MPDRLPPDPRALGASYQMRAFFGFGFIVLGGVALFRVATAAAPAASKLSGGAIGVLLLAFGAFRIAQYVRWRRETERAR